MELIDKAAVITEIERVLNSYDPNEITSGRYALADLRDFINTLEVKEVDLEEEFDEYIKPITAQDIKDEPFTQLFACAQHFYELGLKAKKGE